MNLIKEENLSSPKSTYSEYDFFRPNKPKKKIDKQIQEVSVKVEESFQNSVSVD